MFLDNHRYKKIFASEMKLLCVPLLMILLLTQTFCKWVIVIEYNINRDFVAKNLCINKIKPKLQCNGKCQMMKRLAEEEKQNSSNNTNSTSKEKLPDQVFSHEIDQSTTPCIEYIKISYNEDLPISKHDAPVASIFHPPATT